MGGYRAQVLLTVAGLLNLKILLYNGPHLDRWVPEVPEGETMADVQREELQRPLMTGGSEAANDAPAHRTHWQLVTNSLKITGFWVALVSGVALTFRASRTLDDWAEYFTEASADPEKGGCANPITFYDYLTANSTRVTCEVLPMKSTVNAGVAAVMSEFSAVYMPALTYLAIAAVATAIVVPAVSEIYHRRRFSDPKQRQASFDRLVNYTDILAHEFRGAMRPAVFAIKEVWAPLAYLTGMASGLFAGSANQFANEVSLADMQTGEMPQWQGLNDVLHSWRQLDQASAQSYLTLVERVVDGEVKKELSASFSTGVTLTAGSIPVWMLVFTGSMIAFSVGMGWAALDLFSRWHKAQAETWGEADKQAGVPEGVRKRRAIFFLNQSLDELSQPRDNWARAIKVTRGLVSSVMYITLVSRVLPTFANVGNTMAKAFFPKGPSFANLLKDNWFNHKVVRGVTQHFVKDERAVVVSMASATQTNMGYQTFAVGASVMCALTLVYMVGRVILARRQSQSLPLTQGEARVADADRGSEARWQGHLDTVLTADRWVTYLTGAGLVAIVATAVLMFREHLQGAIGDHCPVGTLGLSMLSSGVHDVFPNYGNCTALVRGEGVVEAVSWAWPVVALGGAALRASLSLLHVGALLLVGVRLLKAATGSAPAATNSASAAAEPGPESGAVMAVAARC